MIESPLARSSDPLASFESAARVIEFKQSQEHQILMTLAIHGALGSSGIAAHCGLFPHEVGKRLTALQRDGRIALTGKIVRASSGRNEREWVAT